MIFILLILQVPINFHYFPKSSGQSLEIKKQRHLIDQKGIGGSEEKGGYFQSLLLPFIKLC